MSGWWLENARIRYNAPLRYPLRHIRKDWYGHGEDPRTYSGKIFILPIRQPLGLKPVSAEDDYDRFHKTLKDMVWEDVFNYDMLRLWPEPEFGVRDVDVGRAKVCAGIVIGTEKMIGEEKLKRFADVYGVTVRTSVFMKPSALSNWAVVKEFKRQIERIGPGLPILLVTLADYDFDGIMGVHYAFKEHFKKFYPEVHHVMAGIFPSQVPSERLNPGDALFEAETKDWLRAVADGRIPEDMAPYEYEGKLYGLEMDILEIGDYLPTILEKLEGLGCTQEVWTEWARERSFPDVVAVERSTSDSLSRDMDEYRQLESTSSKVMEERWKKVEAYDSLDREMDELKRELREIVEGELKGVGKEISEEPDFDDRKEPPPNTLRERVAVQPLEPYETYWDEETKTGFSRRYLEEKLRDGIEEKFEERRTDIEERIEEELTEGIEEVKGRALRTLEEIRTRSSVR